MKASCDYNYGSWRGRISFDIDGELFTCSYQQTSDSTLTRSNFQLRSKFRSSTPHKCQRRFSSQFRSSESKVWL